MSVHVVPTVIYSSMLGMTALALFDAASRPRDRQTLFLAGLLALLLFHILGELFIYTGAYQFAPALAGAQFPVRVLMGPALYFYAHATMAPESALPRLSYAKALSGPALVVLVMLPFIFGMTPAQKLALATPATRDPELWQIALMTCLAAMLVFVLFTGIYLVATLKLHARHRQQLMLRYASLEKRSMDWFKVVLILWGAAWLFFALEYSLVFLRIRWFGAGVVLPVLEALILMIFAHLALKQPVLSDAEKGQPQDDKPRASSLSQMRMKEIASKLQDAMSIEQLFKEEDLSLNRLSAIVAVSENHISETLSQYLHTNFFQFVNAYRIEAAKTLLTSSDKLVSTVAFEVGFNTKSTFNAAFKKSTGMTPSLFRKGEKTPKNLEIPG